MQQVANYHAEITRRVVTVKDARIAVYEQGEGMPVLLLHGSPDNHTMWLPLMERLSGYTRTIAPDLPGFGESTMPPGFGLTLDDEAEFVRGLLDALNITQAVTLVMTDFGGHFGLAFAVKYPDRVRGLVISNTNFFRDYEWHSFAKLYRIPLVGELLLGGTSKAMLSKTLKQVSPDLPDAYVDESYATGFGSPSTRKAILRLYRERNAQDFVGWDDKLLALLEHTPALVLWGDKDPFISKTYGDRWGKAMVRHFADKSHWLPLEAPDDYANAILEWLGTV